MFSLVGQKNLTQYFPSAASGAVGGAGDEYVCHGSNGSSAWDIMKQHQHKMHGAGDEDASLSHAFVHACEAIVQPIILSIGIVSNILSLLVLRNTRIGTVFSICIISLTISDLLASITGFSQILVEVIVFDGDIPFGCYYPEAMASHTLYYLFLMFMCVSSGIIILIVVIRSFMVSRPMESREWLTPRRLRCICTWIAFGTVLIFIPTGMNVIEEVCYHEHNAPLANMEEPKICRRYYDMFSPKVGYKYSYALTVLYGPLLIIVYIICFTSIKMNLKKHNAAAEAMMDGAANAAEIALRVKQTAKVTKVLLVILIAECICIIPTCIQGLGLIIAPNEYIFDKTFDAANIIDVICEIFLCWRPTVNFMIYVCMHKDFRRNFCLLFTKDYACSPSNSGGSDDIKANSCKSTMKSVVKTAVNSQGGVKDGNITQTTTLESMAMKDMKKPLGSGCPEFKDVNGAEIALSPVSDDSSFQNEHDMIKSSHNAPTLDTSAVTADEDNDLAETFGEIDALLAQTEQYLSEIESEADGIES